MALAKVKLGSKRRRRADRAEVEREIGEDEIRCGWPGCKRPAQSCHVVRNAETNEPREYHALCRRCFVWAKPIIYFPESVRHMGVKVVVSEEALTPEIIGEARKGMLVSSHKKEGVDQSGAGAIGVLDFNEAELLDAGYVKVEPAK